MKKNLLMGAALCALGAPVSLMAADPVELEKITVEDTAPQPNRVVLDFEEDVTFPMRDGGELLRSIPGVSGSRMGGHGVDPFIRGQKSTQINLVDDGMYVVSGCPNRMDPPSSYMQLEGNDELVVEKGYNSVTHGPGGCGGTVKTKRNAPIFDADKIYKGSVSAGYDSNGSLRDVALKTSVAMGAQGYVRANAQIKSGDDYEDGNGRKVRSGFKNKGARVDVGFNPTMETKLKVGLQYDKGEDIEFAGAGMDTPDTENVGIRASLDQKIDLGMFTGLEASAYASGVDHVMDNFSLRPATREMRTDSETRTRGGALALSGAGLKIGMDVKLTDQDATAYMNGTTANDIMSHMWPDLNMKEIGLYGEQSFKLNDQSKVKIGLRYDFVDVDANKANVATTDAMSGNRTANDLYRTVYGTEWKDVTEHNFGGILRYDHSFSDALSFFGSLSRSVRTADGTERAIARNSMMATGYYVGNPNLDPEKHHQLEIGTRYQASSWELSGSAFYNRVDDYILRDHANGQDGVLLNNGQTDIYRNVDATLMGFEIGGALDLSEAIRWKSSVAYTRGENDDDNRVLAQIAPLEFDSSVEYRADDWLAGLRMRAAAKQNRADLGANSSGQDTEKTGGYAVFDIYGKIASFQPFDIGLGVSNIFDKTYSNHLNRSNAFDTEVTKVNEPGRSFFLRVNASF